MARLSHIRRLVAMLQLGHIQTAVDGRQMLHVTRRVTRIWYLRQTYLAMLRHGLYKLGPGELLRTQFPYWFRDAPIPPAINLELTNRCQLRCTYCTSPLGLRPRGFMTEETFARVVEQIGRYAVSRVRVVGNGEPTIHPRFPAMMRALCETGAHVELKTNWHHAPAEVVDGVLRAGIEFIRVSVDSNEAAAFSERRLGGNFDKLVHNLARLMQRKRELGARSLVVATVMLAPSDRKKEAEILDFWRPYCDIVSKQYLVALTGQEKDVYIPATRLAGEYPECSLPFRELKIFWNGCVPLCKYAHLQTPNASGVVVGDIHSKSLPELWGHEIFVQYREAHRTRNRSRMPVCRGCVGT